MTRPQIIECGDVTDKLTSARERIAASRNLTTGREMFLDRISPGYEPAGSAARWTDGYWIIWSYFGASRVGRRYKFSAVAEKEWLDRTGQFIDDKPSPWRTRMEG